MNNLHDIVSHFSIDGTVDVIEPMGAGLINDTYRVATVSSDTDDYVLQRINHSIFKDVDLLQRNVVNVTEHIRKKLQERGETDIKRKALRFIPAKDGKMYYFDGESYWRISVLIPKSKAQGLVDELLVRADEMCKAERLHREGILPKRITHCDTKVNNMLFDENGKVLCVIDLDTTMPGYVLSDFGDFIRTAGNTGAEDDANLDNVNLNMDIFKSFAKGYIESAKSFCLMEQSC